MAQLLMPQATAVWLVDNTVLTFRQIAELCDLHELEVQGIADGEVAAHVIGQDPVQSGQVEAEEIKRCEADPEASVRLRERADLPKPKQTKGRYTPVSKRQNKPDAIAWLLRRFPQLADAQIMRLVGTTKQTIAQVRDGTHRNAATLDPTDPVQLGLCTGQTLSAEVEKADAKAEARERNLARARAELAAREAGAEAAAGES